MLDGLVRFPAGLSPTSFHLSPTSFHLSPRLGACGRVPGRLVSHFFSFVSHFFSFVSQAGCLWSGSRPACLPLLFICLPLLFICLPGWVLVVGFPAGLSPTSFHLSPTSFHLSPRLGACGRVPGRLVSHFFSFVSHFFSFVSQAGCLWSGSRPACLPLLFICLPVLFICLPGWVLVVGFPAGLSPTSFHLSPSSFHLSPRLGACGLVPGWLVSHFFSFVSQFFSFVSQAGCLWSGSRLACLPLPFGFPAGLSPTSFHLSPSSFHLSPRLGACGRLACLPRPFICLPLLFICLPSWVLVVVVGFPAGLSPTSLHLSPTFPPNSLLWGSQFFLKMSFVSLLVSAHFHWPCSISIRLSPRSVTAGVRPFLLAM